VVVMRRVERSELLYSRELLVAHLAAIALCALRRALG
jgi:hypothetical protein